MVRLKQSLLFSLACLLVGCFSEPEGPVKIGTNKWPGYEPLYLARHHGHYEGERIWLVELASASEVIHEFRNGNLDGAALTLDEALVLLEDGLEISIVLVMDFSAGGDVLLAQPEFASVDQLKGKKIAVETTAVGAIMLDGALESAGLLPEDITIIGCSVDEHVRIFDRVDAVVTFEPAKTALEKLGAVILFDSSEIPRRIVDVLVVRRAVMQERPIQVRALLAGYFQARKTLEENPEGAAKIMAGRLNVTPDELLASYGGLHLPGVEENRKLLTDPDGLDQAAKDLADLMHRKGLLRKPIQIDRLASPEFLPTE